MLSSAMHVFQFGWVNERTVSVVVHVVLSRGAKIWLCGIASSLAFDRALKPIP